MKISMKRLHVIENSQKINTDAPTNVVKAKIGEQINFNPTALDTFDVKGCQGRVI